LDNFVFALPTRIVFGPGAIESVGQEAAALGQRALVITGSTFVRRSGLIDHLCASLTNAGVSVSIYDEVDRNPTVDTIDRGGRAARERSTDIVVGLGGGSALDAAKAIAVTACSDRSIWDYTRHSADSIPSTIEETLPIVQVPIIASTGSETNDRAVVLDEASEVKAPIRSSYLYARVAIVDPTLTFSVPARFTAVGAMNIVSQMLEGYLTSDEFAVTDRVTEGLMRVVMDSLPRALRRAEDLDARNNLSWAAALASTIAMAGRGGSAPLRAMVDPVSAKYKIEHGSATAALWPSYMRYALGNRFRLPQIGRFKRYALLGRQIFGVHETDDEVASETMVHRFVSWLRSMEMPTDLRQLGIDDAPITQLADQAILVSGHGTRLPSGLGVEDIEHIYEGALRPS
jgi:butanol dehydrogenase